MRSRQLEHVGSGADNSSISDEICVADTGMVTVWICFGCFEAQARIETG